MGSESDLFRLASVDLDPELAEGIDSVFLKDDISPDGEKFVFEDSFEFLNRLGEIKPETPDGRVKPLTLFEGSNSGYTGKEVDAFADLLGEQGIIEQDRYGRIDPTSYSVVRDHQKVKDTLKGIRFDKRRQEGFTELDNDDIEFYLTHLDEDIRGDVLMMAQPIAAGLSGYNPNSHGEIENHGLYCINNSQIPEEFDLEPDFDQVNDTFRFLTDLGLGEIKDGVYLPDSAKKYDIGVLDTLRSQYDKIDDPWAQEEYQASMDEFEDRRSDDKVYDEDYNDQHRPTRRSRHRNW